MGILRLILALSVITGHADTTLFGLLWVNAFYAVQAFFAISGFYMALVLNERYASLPLRAFYRSRALRIYPTYFVGVGLMLLVAGRDVIAAVHGMTSSTKIFFYVQNLVIFGQDLSYVFCMREKVGGCASAITATINPPAWSLSIELGFYLVAPFIVRHPRRIAGLIAVGTLYLLLTRLAPFPMTGREPFALFNENALTYYFYPSSFIFFGAGALAYHLRQQTAISPYPLFVVAIAAFAYVNTIMPPWDLTILALAIPELFKLTKANRYDRIIGDFSYPLYILHWPILVFVQKHPGLFSPVQPFMTVGTIVSLLSALAAVVVYLAIDRPLNAIRHPSSATARAEGPPPLAARALLVAYVVLPFITLAAMVR